MNRRSFIARTIAALTAPALAKVLPADPLTAGVVACETPPVHFGDSYPMWRNWSATYNPISNQDLADKLTRALNNTGFKPCL